VGSSPACFSRRATTGSAAISCPLSAPDLPMPQNSGQASASRPAATSSPAWPPAPPAIRAQTPSPGRNPARRGAGRSRSAPWRAGPGEPGGRAGRALGEGPPRVRGGDWPIGRLALRTIIEHARRMTRRPPPGTIPATADNALKAQAVLWLMCANCDREKKADLAAIMQRGLGNVPISDLKFRCSACGSTKVHPHLSSTSAERFRPREGE
jgi:hypothetical protein